MSFNKTLVEETGEMVYRFNPLQSGQCFLISCNELLLLTPPVSIPFKSGQCLLILGLNLLEAQKRGFNPLKSGQSLLIPLKQLRSYKQH